MSEDYYQTLGLDRGASQAEIERAYREKARQFHPDLNPDDKAAKDKFQQVQRAFDVLKDPEKRDFYDQTGRDPDSMGQGGPGAPGGPGARGFRAGPGGVEFDFSEMFGDRFGGGAAGFEDLFRGAARTRTARGRDIHHELRIPFNTAILGGEAQLSVRRSDGRIETIQVKIPAGIEDGKRIRLRGQGEAPPTGEGQHGDILITVRVSPHPCFKRSGNNLEVRVPVTLAEAALGAKVEIPTPSGAITLNLPAGTSSGAKLRVKGHGVKPDGRAPGDLLAEIQISLPKTLNADAQELIRQIDDQYAESPRSKLKW
jgi:DnaJ-class molecular chaperone